ncbi:hypothetical protein D0Z07_1559 [Hyphodiscus hymeniophilus]|uniref:N-acetyltransferase domain-containing protein n=1 Tax=Hyphodiscus hymeniophilus TaxID=353542 RepID=A0A9P6VPW3_9HELO|nr:hypothetical protein D0Z07_1559 [Hyphodiscus hymeniophilus]
MTDYAHETPRLWLQKMTVEDHLQGFHQLWNKEEATQSVKETVEDAKAWMLTTLPTPEDPDIDKYAILLRPVEENPQPWVDERGRPTMIGMTGTNRFSDEGMETGYCMHVAYWGRGYAGEAFRGFLELFWGLEERRRFMQLVAKVDEGNVASSRIIARAGGVKAGILKEWYSRPGSNGVKGDVAFWLIDRPGVSEDEMKEWKEEIKKQMVRKKELEKAKEERKIVEKQPAERLGKE